MSETINGYLVVRRRENNFDFRKREYFRHSALRVGEIYYGGIDRMPWIEIEDLIDDEPLSDVGPIWKRLEDENFNDFTGIVLCRSFELAQELLRRSNNPDTINELVVIHSEKLDDIKGSLIHDQTPVRWYGYDPVSLGSWSLLLEGLFAAPNYFLDWTDKLNEYGLFSNADDALRFAEAYLEREEDDGPEPVSVEPYGISAVRVGAVQHSS